MRTSTVDVEVPGATSVRVTEDSLTVELSDGRTIAVPLDWYPRLVHATPDERDNYELYAERQHIHWPELDEDIGVEGLLEGRASGESAKSFQRWLEAKRAGRPLTLDALRRHDREQAGR
jgi:hypothetical protein